MKMNDMAYCTHLISAKMAAIYRTLY